MWPPADLLGLFWGSAVALLVTRTLLLLLTFLCLLSSPLHLLSFTTLILYLRMETSVKAAELLVPPGPDKASSLETENLEGEAAASTSSDSFDPMEEFSRRLQDILRTHGSADGLLDKPVVENIETDKTKQEVEGDLETDISLIKQSLNNLSSSELVQKFAELAVLQRSDEQRMSSLQQKLCILLEERQQLQAERRCSIAARCKLEALCRDLQNHYSALREETLQRCREDEEKRNEITNHFQEMLTEIQAQIEQHSVRNDKLHHENANLTDKLESLMNQYERREESLEKINKHRDLQHKLTEAKLQQANALLTEAEEKHKREKEYLLVQAAEWKLQAKTLREQATVMQAQLTLYAQKFDEFQATLAKSNEIYVRFKNEMDNMTEKMKKVEKEANLWKTRFENCNKTLIDMIEERTEKGREYNMFVLKIQKLEKLCHALQDERKGLYDKIREVRQSNANLPSKLAHFTENSDVSEEAAIPDLEGLQELQEEDPVLMENIARLREEQAKLQEFATSLLATPEDNAEQEEKNELDAEDDLVVSAIVQFKTKTEVKEGLVSVPDQVEDAKSSTAESGFTQTAIEEKVQAPSLALLEAPKPERTKSEPIDPVVSPEVGQVQTQVQVREVQQAKSAEHVQQSGPPTAEPAEMDPEPLGGEVDPEPKEAKADTGLEGAKPYPEPNRPKGDPEAEALKTESLEETSEVNLFLPVEELQVQQQPASDPEQVAEKSTQLSEGSTKPAVSSMKQKKRKKRNNKSTS
ncbi:beta-taxilin isoform X1 [Girardinichthys multiradiatus]|uniref:beta-taxilin isoform X1 n=1 Tax=Girardinichthys multiradiatus TaxID=208333 RepID=UPI001FAD5284|nr:beta-taxilin isoform X1 [Girardinichthys multiradiatus]